jgi:membrane-associated HD superfamily phosphohydrolase
MTSVYEWHCSHACTSALVIMGRTLDLPSVIELTPCKYKRVYFYFGVQKKLIFIYLFILFLFLFFGADLTFILRPIWLVNISRGFVAIVTLKTIQECCRVCNKSYFFLCLNLRQLVWYFCCISYCIQLESEQIA